MITNKKITGPPVSFYTLFANNSAGRHTSFEIFKGKKVLLVNTASACDYTRQLEELQMLQLAHREDLVVIAFPSNDFKQQEPGKDDEIAAFCSINYHTDFTMFQKSKVIKGADQNPVYNWLSHSDQNGWNNWQPSWNFTKYLVNEHGILTHYFEAGISPAGKRMAAALQS